MTLVLPARRAPSGWKADARHVDVRRTRRGSLGLHPGDEGYYGNPYPVTEAMPAEEAVRLFEAYAEDRILRDPEYRDAVRSLSGRVLVCACSHSAPACHARVLARIADRLSGADGWARVPVRQLDVAAAVRYHLSRAGTADEARRLLEDAWPMLGAAVREIVERDVEDSIRRDDHARSLGNQGGIGMPLGYDDNRRDWERVRALWREA